MNFLAHLYLCDGTPGSTPEALVGSIMPDLVRGKLPADLPPSVRAAVDQHRRIDAFTDTHPIVARSKRRLANQGRYAGILVDVFYDHFLAADWPRWSDVPLPDFIARVHFAFATRAHFIPEPMRYPIDRMIEQDWLASYASIEGIELTLRRMSVRLSARFEREVRLHDAIADLREQYADLGADFRAFFPELIRCARGGAAG